jgi:hypothetical protein
MTNRDQDDVLSTATDRFERRLAEECGRQRMETAQLRVDVIKGDADIRGELSGMRLDMVKQFAESRLDAEAKHRKILKWAVVFWAGQAAAVAGIVSAVGYFFARR